MDLNSRGNKNPIQDQEHSNDVWKRTWSMLALKAAYKELPLLSKLVKHNVNNIQTLVSNM